MPSLLSTFARQEDETQVEWELRRCAAQQACCPWGTWLGPGDTWPAVKSSVPHCEHDMSSELDHPALRWWYRDRRFVRRKLYHALRSRQQASVTANRLWGYTHMLCLAPRLCPISMVYYGLSSLCLQTWRASHTYTGLLRCSLSAEISQNSQSMPMSDPHMHTHTHTHTHTCTH